MTRVIVIIIYFFSMIYCQDKVATSAANFLGIPMGSKAMALGGSYSSMTSDASSIFYNPGSISRSKKNHFTLNNTDWFLDSKIIFIAGTFKINNTLTLGSYITNLDYGKEEITDFENQDGTGTYWSANDFAAGATLSFNLTNRFSIGGTLKYIIQRIYNEKASSIATDIGLLFSSDVSKFNMGFSISNFGLNMMLEGKDLYQKIDLDPESGGNNETIVAKIKTEYWPLPIFLRIGMSKLFQINQKSNTTFTTDFIIPSDDAEILSNGIELKLYDIFSLRIGHSTTLNDFDDEYISAGFGLNTSIGKSPVRIDYSIQNRNILGSISSLGISFLF